jgi:hypothetical protein
MVMKNNLASQKNKSNTNNYLSNDVEIVAGAGQAKAKLAYLVVGSGLKFVHQCTKEKVT